MASTRASGRTTDGSEFDGTTEGTDRVAPGALSDATYVLTSVVFYTEGTIPDLEIIIWDPDTNERAGKLGGDSSSEQTWAGEFHLPVSASGVSYEVRVVTTTQSADLAKLAIDGYITGVR